MKHILSILVFLALLMIGTARLSIAQTSDMRNMIENLAAFLEQNGEILERALEAVRSSSNPLAEKTLAQAFELQKNALSTFRNASSGTDYEKALMLGRLARERAKQALEAARLRTPSRPP